VDGFSFELKRAFFNFVGIKFTYKIVQWYKNNRNTLAFTRL